MSKPGKRKREGSIGEPFIPVLKSMVTSFPFKELTNAGRVAYILLKLQVQKTGQQEVIFPYSHAEPYMNRHTFGSAIKQLIELEFIEKSDFGGLFRRTNVYKFLEGWRNVKK